MDFPTKEQLDAFSAYNQQFMDRMFDRLGTDKVTPSYIGTSASAGYLESIAVSLPSAATVYHVEEGEGGSLLLISPAQWRTIQTERGVCWMCGDQLPPDARFCISCRTEVRPPVTGKTERLS